MVKILIFLLLIVSFSFANVYENNCVKCHNDLPVSIDKFFYRYLLKYSGEKSLKNGMKSYLENPTKKSSIMPEAFIKRFGVKNKTDLNSKELQKALDIYWEKYKVFGKLE